MISAPVRAVVAAFTLLDIEAGDPAVAAREPGTVPEVRQQTQLKIPDAVRAEHEEIQAALGRATKKPGRVGVAARALAAVLHPHFVREEQIALPPLGLVAPLARGEFDPSMLAVLPLTDSLRTELPQMLKEHRAIGAATRRLRDAARAASDASVVRLADALLQHAKSEEELLYPTAVLVGDVVRARSEARH